MTDRLRRTWSEHRASLPVLFGAVLASAWLAVCGVAAAPARSLPRLSATQLAGARVIYSYAGLQPPASLLSEIRAGEVGGVIFFGSNISSLEQIRGVIRRLQAAAKASPAHVPLLLMTDQEGGEVRRLPGAPVRSEKAIGERRDATRAATRAGTGAGRLLASVGMDVNLAPVLDVYRSAGDFDDQYGRSYSRNPATVARLGSAFVRAQQRTGVAATVKHFPGLGAASASQNTDERPVTLNVSLSRLRSIDERPFASALADGARLVMTSWAVYPALDPSRPAGLSARVVGGELRGRLGFNGVTITDSIDAGALARYGSLGNRAVLAARAGADLILCSQPNRGVQGISVVRALARAISDHRIGRAATQAAVSRILSLRRHP